MHRIYICIISDMSIGVHERQGHRNKDSPDGSNVSTCQRFGSQNVGLQFLKINNFIS